MSRYGWTLAALLALTPAAACADPGYYVVTAYDNAGKAFVDFRYWTAKARNGAETVWPELGVGYGINSRWTTEVFASLIGPANLRTRLSSINWQNDVLLTQGEWPLDVALHTQLVRSPGDGTTAIEAGPALQTDIGRTQVNLNLFFERIRGSAAPPPTRLKYQWQIRYRWQRGLHVGAQGFGELGGSWDEWAPAARQSHRAGPAVFSELPLGHGQTLKLQAAWLVGKTYTRRGHMFTGRVVVEY